MAGILAFRTSYNIEASFVGEMHLPVEQKTDNKKESNNFEDRGKL
jgi:hypothetical protein